MYKKLTAATLSLLLASSLSMTGAMAAKGGNADHSNSKHVKKTEVKVETKVQTPPVVTNAEVDAVMQTMAASTEEASLQIATEMQTAMEDLKKTTDLTKKRQKTKQVADQLKLKLEQLQETFEGQEDVLAQLAGLYEKANAISEAVEVQKEAVKLDSKNLQQYRKLAKLLEKQGKKQIKAFVNGVEASMDVPPVIKEGRTLVPIRAISESLKAEVSYDAATKTVTIKRDGTEIKLVLNKVTAYVNGKEVKMDVPAQSINARTVIPVRFISQLFNAAVQWDAESQTVIVNDDAAAEAPATDAPATDAPATDAPATEAPATNAPATETPATDAPATDAPATSTEQPASTDATAPTATTEPAATEATAPAATEPAPTTTENPVTAEATSSSEVQADTGTDTVTP